MDDDQSFEKRPSIWNEPIGEWSAGVVQLTEIPSDNDVNDNIVAFWRPKAPLQAGQEQSYVYRQYWCWLPPERPPLAAVGTTRTGRAGGRRRRFEVDFYDDSFKMPEEFSEMKPQISTNVGIITRVRKYFYPDRRLCRISFELDPGNETLAELVSRVEHLRLKENEVQKIISKLAKEKQFNRKVEINAQLRAIRQELENLTN